jgi:hypothetical protein
MPTLVLTIQGPFAYVPNYPVMGLLTLMAPMCNQHKGGISGIGINNEFLFRGNGCNQGPSFEKPGAYEYLLGINSPVVGNPTWKSEGNLVAVSRTGLKLDSTVWRFYVIVPLPDVIATVNPVNAKIKSTETQKDPPYAVGMRFIYKQWDGNDIVISLNGKPAIGNDGQPAVLHYNDLGEDKHWDLEIEYAGPVRDDPDHEDAVNCFQTLMTALGHPDWSIGFPIRQPEVTHRNDCKAAIAWVE